MRDCTNPMMKDRLPDLLHDRLLVAERVEVELHVAACENCRADLVILRRVVAVAVAPHVDANRIAASLPPYRASAFRRLAHAPQLRIAAAIVFLAVGATVIGKLATRPNSDSMDRSPQPPVVATQIDVPTAVAESAAVPERRHAPTELAVGETLNDLSASDLRTLLDEVGKLEAMTSAETEIVLPSIGRGGE